MVKLGKGKVILLPCLRNTGSENIFCTSSVAYKNEQENYYDANIKIYSELNNIISNIHGESQLIELLSKDGNISNRKYLNDGVNLIIKNCLRLTKTINNIIEVIKFEKKQTQLYANNVNIVEIIDSIVINTSKQIKGKIIFDTDIEEKYISCDIRKLQKAVLILLSIAVKYSHEKEVSVYLSTVEDQININISFNNINKILFNDYLNKMDNLSPEDLDELSLNFYLVKSLIYLHEGRISVGGTGDETIFKIELPCNNTDTVYYFCNNKIIDESLNQQIQIEFSDIC